MCFHGWKISQDSVSSPWRTDPPGFQKRLYTMRILFLFLSFLLVSCAPPSVYEKSPCEKCTVDQTCIDNECVNNDKICGTAICTADETCTEGTCIDTSGKCGGVYCEDLETCIDHQCRQVLNMATFNVYDLSLPFAHSNFAQFMVNNNIDFITVQEIQPQDTGAVLNALRSYDLEYSMEMSTYGGYGGDTGNDYLAVFSRHEILSADTILGGTYTDPLTGQSFSFSNMRPVLRVVLNVFGNEVTVYNFHLKAQVPYPECDNCTSLRRAQAHALETRIIEDHDTSSDYIICAGDANTAISEDFEPGNTLDMLTLKSDEEASNDFLPVNHELLNVTTHTDFDSELDHIILSPALQTRYIPDSVEVIAPLPSPSDHKAVITRISLD